jgi:PPOX class probable F420-dependent enzyme
MRRNGLHHVPKSFRDLLADQARALAYLATVMPAGTPQVTPLWFDADGDCIRINSARGRVKDRNMRARPAVALLIQDPRADTRYIQIRGHVVEVTEAGALEHIDRLCMKYRGKHWKPIRGQVRVTYIIAPDSVSVSS